MRVQQVQGLRPIFLVLSPAYKPLDNPKVRRAITHAIDRERIIKHILEGYAYPLSGLLSPQVFGYEPSAKAYPYDPEKAKQLLDRSRVSPTDLRSITTAQPGAIRRIAKSRR